MAKFVFTLQPVLGQRIREEERAMLVLGERERARVEAEARVHEIREQMESERDDWKGRLAPVGTVDLREVRMQAGATLRDLAVLKSAMLSMAAAERAVAGARAALLEAARRRRAIEELKERRWSEWKAEQLRMDQRSIDELVVMGHGRQGPADEWSR